MTRTLWGVVGAAVAVLVAVGIAGWLSVDGGREEPAPAPVAASEPASPTPETTTAAAPAGAAPERAATVSDPEAGAAPEAPAAGAGSASPDAPDVEVETAEATETGAATAEAAQSTAALPVDAPSAPTASEPDSAPDGAETASGEAATDPASDPQVAAVSPPATREAEDAPAEQATAGSGADREPDTDISAAADIALDIVRIDPAGESVIAGRATPGATVEILLDGAVFARETVGGDGAFVAIVSLGRSDEARALQVRLAGAEATEVAEAGAAEPGEVLALAEPGAAGVSAPIVILPTAEEGAAPVVVSPGAGEVALLQPAEVEVRRVVLDRITYSPGGDAVASGRARAGHAVRAYVNAVYVADVTVATGGTWEVALPRGVAESARLLRFDEVSADGEVTSRLETAFTYDDGNNPVETRQRLIRVQRGDNLWRIAEQYYGRGLRYSLIYGANEGLIIDPDLIYPGQVFTIPELIASE